MPAHPQSITAILDKHLPNVTSDCKARLANELLINLENHLVQWAMLYHKKREECLELQARLEQPLLAQPMLHQQQLNVIDYGQPITSQTFCFNADVKS